MKTKRIGGFQKVALRWGGFLRGAQDGSKSIAKGAIASDANWIGSKRLVKGKGKREKNFKGVEPIGKKKVRD